MMVECLAGVSADISHQKKNHAIPNTPDNNNDDRPNDDDDTTSYLEVRKKYDKNANFMFAFLQT